MKKIFLALAILLLSLLLFHQYYLSKVSQIQDEIYIQKSNSIRTIFQNEVGNEHKKTAALTYLISQGSSVVDALVEDDPSMIDLKQIVEKIEHFGGYEDFWIQVIDRYGFSFYRSWTNKVGDYVAIARADIGQMLSDPKPMQTISTGRFDMTFKTMLPIFYHGEFLGMVESISKFNSIADMLVEREIEPLMVVDEAYTKRFIKPYSGLFIDNNYVANSNANRDLMQFVQDRGLENFSSIKDYKIFDKYLVSIDKIDGVDGLPMGLFIFFTPTHTIDFSAIAEYKATYLSFVIAFMIIFLLGVFYFINRGYVKVLSKEVKKHTSKIQEQKEALKSLLNIYDKNVIFSKTDLKGNIIHASEAFCKISGYSQKELLGKPHNIVRHPDMLKESFAYLWRELKQQKSVKLEIKNRKKDGGFYWVEAEFEPYYDKTGKHIGYSAVRKDITANKEIEEIQKEIIFTMGSIGESRSQETGNHVKRVAEYSRILAKHYGMYPEQVEMLVQASPMHDIGKVAIADSILHKPGKLTDEEFQVIKEHAIKGHELLSSSYRPLLKTAATIALTHHEKYDGSGYPYGLEGEDIHIYGRITAVADVFDALGSDRCYKKAWRDEDIFAFFKTQRGKHFDPKLIDIFFEHLDEFLEIRQKIKDM